MAADLNPRFVDMLIGFEALKTEAYQDAADVWTIGAGVTVYPDGRRVQKGDKLGLEEARALSVQVMAERRAQVAALLPGLPEHEIDACASLAYNIGTEAFAGSTCRRRLLAGDLKGAAAALKWWNKSTVDGVKTVLPGLVTRREAEAELLMNGWTGDSGPAIAAGSVEENPPAVVRTRAIGGVILAALGTSLPWLIPLLPDMLTQAVALHGQLVAKGMPWGIAAASAGVTFIGLGIVAWAKRQDTADGRILPKEAVGR